MSQSLVAQRQVTTFASPVAGTSPIDANVVRGNDNAIKTVYNGHDGDPTIHFQDSTNAARPAAATAGRKWIDNDTYRVYYDDGGAWHEIAYLSSGGGTMTGALAIQSASANALAVGLNGATNPAFNVDASTASQAAGLNVVGAVAAGTVAVSVISSGAAANLSLNAKGTGTIAIGNVSTGTVTITPATTITGTATLSGAVTINQGANTYDLWRTGSNPSLDYSSAAGAFRFLTGVAAAAAVTMGALSASTGSFSSTLGINGASQIPQAGIQVQGNFSGATSQYGIISQGTFGSGATVSGTALFAQVLTAAASFTMTSAYGLYIQDAVKGAGSTITTQYGILVDNQTKGTTNYAIYTGTGPVRFGDALTISAGGIAVTGASQFNDNVTIAAKTLAFTGTGAGSNSGIWNDSGGDGLILQGASATNVLAIRAPGGTRCLTIGPAGVTHYSTIIGDAALATSATDGFLYIPTCAGTPTGVPTSFTGRIPLIYDTTNNFLYFYNGGAWKKSTVYA